jgi:uncharacterized protein (TIGR00297 family)
MNVDINIVILFLGIIAIYLLRILTIPALILAATMAFFFIQINLLMLIPPLIFFLSASLWTRWPGKSKKDRRRNIRQVAANGGIALVVVLLFKLFNIENVEIVITATFAAAAADTWATEWGSSFGGSPLSLKTLRYTEPGQSGAVSLVGSLAMIAGSVLVANSGYFIGLYSHCFVLPITISGILGAIVDSLAGAHIQALWRDSSGNILEDRPLNDLYTRKISGINWIDNDFVNLLATLSAAVIAWIWIR